MDNFTLKEIRSSMAPFALSPIPGPKTPTPTSWLTKIFGIRTVRDLGLLTTALNGGSDGAIVQRSWGLLNYGPKFRFTEYMKTRNYLTGILFHFAALIGGLLLVLKPFRWVMKKFVYQPGDGPTKEEARNDHFEYRGIAVPDVEGKNPPRAFCRARFEGSAYVCMYSHSHPAHSVVPVNWLMRLLIMNAVTGISLAEAAISILSDEHQLSGGVYTPASLGQKFIDRLQGAGVKFEKKFFED
jgi:hypothetical protein